MCKLWIYLSLVVNCVLISSALTTQLLFPINPLILLFLLSYISYKIYSIHVVATFIREIKSYGGFNAALSGLSDAEVEEFEKGNPPEVGALSADKSLNDALTSVRKQAYNTQFEIPFTQLQLGGCGSHLLIKIRR